MTGSGGGDQPPPPPVNGGEFLLSLLQRHNINSSPTPTHSNPQPQSQQPPLQIGSTDLTQHRHQQPLVHDPAVAAFGPTIGFQSAPSGLDFPSTTTHFHWPNSFSPPLNSSLLGFPQYPFNQLPVKQFPGNQALLTEDFQRLGFGGNTNNVVNNLVQQNFQQQEHPKLVFGSFRDDSIQQLEGLLNRNVIDNTSATEDRELSNRKLGSSITGSQSSPILFQHWNHDSRELEQRDRVAWENHHRRVNQSGSGNYNSFPLNGIPSKHGGGPNLDLGGNSINIKAVGYNVDKGAGDCSGLSYKGIHLSGNERVRGWTVNNGNDVGLSRQLDHPGPPGGSNLASVSARDTEKSPATYHSEVEQGVREKTESKCKTQRETSCSGHGGDGSELDDFGEELVESLLLDDEAVEKNDNKQHRNSREKESRKDNRGQQFLSQRVRNIRRQMVCRHDIHRFNGPFLAIFESLNPPEEEKTKQKQLLTLLEKLVKKEWPEAGLYLYGSCANSFGVSKSDIDVCLTINDPDVNKSEILLKLAEVLKSDNLQNVQALTRARVPIVKLMDPVTRISCDICINNVLAVVNTKLLHDYARIDERLRQLVFIVKHWAKSRGVNETYQGTLSSYAYVLMCIHFLQQCSPAILPCLQEMRVTYSVTVDGIKCGYFDQVDKLRNFGSHNKETIAQLVWGFFIYWAYCHDYANEVISVRTGSIISKQEKDWTRRVGNDRHLICIEDPFEITHDLGRVVDKYSIKVLREEFERAAEVMQYARNPCVTLFEPYIPS